MKIAITGGNGLVGSKIQEVLATDFEFVQISQDQIDITNRDALHDFVTKLDFDLLFHLAAFTDVDGSEAKKDLAHNVNVNGTKNLFEITQEMGKQMIYISTDFVFDGTNPPYDEDSTPNPLGTYASTKYEGEKIVSGHAMIVRISYPYGNPDSMKPDLITKLKSLLAEGRELTFMTDSTITPTYIEDIALGLKYLFNHYDEKIYHLVGSQSVTPFELAELICDRWNFDKKLLKPTTWKDYSVGKAPRPQYSTVTSKYNTFHKMRSIKEGLELL